MTAAKMRVIAAFDRAADYDLHAPIQKQVAQQLAEAVQSFSVPPSPRVLEIGCGTGFLAEALSKSIVGADWLMTDIAPAMVDTARARFGGRSGFRFAVIDGEHPRFDAPEAPFDLICSNLALQWFEDLDAGLDRLMRLLKPGGQLLFSTMLDGSFAEWRSAHDELGFAHGMHPYPIAGELRDLLRAKAGDVETATLLQPYASAREFLRALRAIGAATPVSTHRPLGAGAMRKVMRVFEENGAVARYHVAICRLVAG